MEFTKHLGRFRALWSELEMLRPSTTDEDELIERREQDKVFGLLLTLNPAYNSLIKHILRAEKLPSLEDVCAQIQKEQGSIGLFGGKGELTLASQATQETQGEGVQANKAVYGRNEDRRFNGTCDHCKKHGHKKSQCWILHPHLKPAKFMKDKEGRAHIAEGSNGAGSSKGVEGSVREAVDGKSMVAHTSSGGGSTSSRNIANDYIRRSDIEDLIKMLKDNGNIIAHSFGASLITSTLEEPSLDKINEPNTTYRSLMCHNAKNLTRPLIIDSGATHHMISDTSLIKDLEPANGNVLIANGDRIPIKGTGTLRLFNRDSKALYMPEFTNNLVSVRKCTKDLNCNVIFTPNDVRFQDIKSSKMIGKGATNGDLYVLEDLAPASNNSCFNSTFKLNKCALWHARLGHPHVRALNLMLPGVVFENNECEACILGKHCKTVFEKSSTIYDKCFDLIHSDVWTAPCLSRENHKYFVTFIDEKSKYTWLTLISSKDRVIDAFRNFQAYVTNHYHAKIKIFRSDNGGEYTSRAFKDHLAQHGILHQTSCPYTPQQNGVSERKNRHLMEVARSMMFQGCVPKRFWSDAVTTACYLINRTPTRVLEDQSPFEVLNKHKPHLNHLRVFGCLSFVFIPGELRNKLEAKSTRTMFIGYSTGQKGYKCYDPVARRVLVSRDVKFIEDRGYYDKETQEDLNDLTADRGATLRIIMERLGIKTTHDPRSHVPNPHDHDEASKSPHLDHEGGNERRVVQEEQEPQEPSNCEKDLSGQNDQEEEQGSGQDDDREGSSFGSPDQGVASYERSQEDVDNQGGEEQETVEQPQPLRRSTRIRHPPSNWVNTRVYYNAQAVEHPSQAVCSFSEFPKEHCLFMANLDENSVPRSYEEAMQDQDWRNSVKDEADAMVRNETWYESELPRGKKVVTSRWIFTIKFLPNGKIERKKTRLVARGYTLIFLVNLSYND